MSPSQISPNAHVLHRFTRENLHRAGGYHQLLHITHSWLCDLSGARRGPMKKLNRQIGEMAGGLVDDLK